MRLVTNWTEVLETLCTWKCLHKLLSQVREKFRHWIDARNASLSLEEDIPDVDCNSFGSAAESELERLVSPEQCSVSQPVPEEDFDYLAEKIANRVKEDLGIPLSSAPLEGTPSTLISLKDSRKPTWDSDRGRTFTQEEPTFLHNGTPTFRSHSCTVCKKLMVCSIFLLCFHYFVSLCALQMISISWIMYRIFKYLSEHWHL